jgi:hypothetical protein
MNVGFEVDANGGELTGTATWANILKLYKIDKQNTLCCLLHDMTHRHLNPIAQDAMTITLAAQVMSSTAAAAVDSQVTAGKERCS